MKRHFASISPRTICCVALFLCPPFIPASVAAPVSHLKGRIFLKEPQPSIALFPKKKTALTSSLVANFEAEKHDTANGWELITRYKGALNGELLLEDKTIMAFEKKPKPGTMNPKMKFVRYEFHQKQSREDAVVTSEQNELQFHLEKWDFENHILETSDDSEGLREGTVSFSQLQGVVLQEWDHLMKENDLDLRVIIPSRLETVGLTLKIIDKGEKVVRFQMKPSSVFIAMFAGPIFFEFTQTAPHAFKRMEGRLPIKSFDEEGDYSDIEGILELN